MRNKKIAILGGGLTGLTLANLLQKKYSSVTVFEKDSIPGGLCRSFQFDNFTFDIGGHIIFSKDQEVLNFMINTIGRKNLFQKPCRDAIVYKNKLVNYPFETDLAKLGKEESFECLRNFIINNQKEPKDFHEWLHHTFGKSLAEKYLIPYNRKIWKIEPKELDLGWVERIPKPSTEEMIKSCMGIPFESKIPRKNFFYPKKGGMQVLTNNLAKKVKDLRLNSEVKKIERIGKNWKVKTSLGQYEFNDIISTIPIFDLAKSLKVIPKNIKGAIDGLRYNSIIIVCLGINKAKIINKTACYFPDEKILPSRVCFMNSFSPNNSPRRKSSLICEITFRPKSDISKMNDVTVLKNVVDGFEKVNLFKKRDIVLKKVLRFPYAYVVYDKNYTRNTKTIYSWLKKQKINTVGRFAEFQYLNMDACIRHAFDFVDKYSL